MPAEYEETISLELKRKAHQFPMVRDKVLKTAANMYAKELEKRTPISDIDKKHAKESVVVSKVNDEGEVSIGWTKPISSRIHITEFGSINQKPQNFVGGTIDDLEKDIMKFISRELQKGLGLT